MSFFGATYCWFCRISSYLQSPLLLLIRLFWGYQFVVAGWGKFMNIEATSRFFANLGIPYPLFNAYFVGTVECVGGILIIIGLLSRLAALVLAINMVVAYLTAHHHAIEKLFENPDIFVGEAPFLFFYMSLIVLAFGPGFFSLDAFWKRKSSH